MTKARSERTETSNIPLQKSLLSNQQVIWIKIGVVEVGGKGKRLGIRGKRCSVRRFIRR